MGLISYGDSKNLLKWHDFVIIDTVNFVNRKLIITKAKFYLFKEKKRTRRKMRKRIVTKRNMKIVGHALFFVVYLFPNCL